ncbi:MAG TPA: hypothetical protein PLC98_03700 [Anaerolineales bacterium]|nr:hypothetical protein [Anaerolineales bacterium]
MEIPLSLPRQQGLEDRSDLIIRRDVVGDEVQHEALAAQIRHIELTVVDVAPEPIELP